MVSRSGESKTTSFRIPAERLTTRPSRLTWVVSLKYRVFRSVSVTTSEIYILRLASWVRENLHSECVVLWLEGNPPHNNKTKRTTTKTLCVQFIIWTYALRIEVNIFLIECKLMSTIFTDVKQWQGMTLRIIIIMTGYLVEPWTYDSPNNLSPNTLTTYNLIIIILRLVSVITGCTCNAKPHGRTDTITWAI